MCNNLALQYKTGSSNKKKATQLASWALKRIKILYESAQENVPVLEGPKGQEPQKDPLDGVMDSFLSITIG